ncbi:unnamed protein product [Rhizoctonia solani]|uniref:CHAT domain-containing protein n=1 Tax=Rhizoctonia solani TaxID=456999 RepID=A0A8H3BWS4_9AGAM|nr:unnamed protein product [Rhizoctonia solani]
MYTDGDATLLSYFQETAVLNMFHFQTLRSRGVRGHGRHIRKLTIDSDLATQHRWRSALYTIWEGVVLPVIESLELKPTVDPSDMPHITWCVTGPLSFLPIHAAGCYDNEPSQKLMDFAVSSYTPTLGALLAIKTPPSLPSSMLLVGQEATLGQTPLPGTKDELDPIKKHIPESLKYTQLIDHHATTMSVLAALADHDWVHLACHAHQNTTHPTESGFFLHDATLDLAQITQRSFRNKGLAFLSACQTAKGDDNLPDESVHLATGLLMAGYTSVIATMWSVSDSDAPVVADIVYRHLLKDGHDHVEVSKAWHNAVKKLREKVGEIEFARWVPFIHIGV